MALALALTLPGCQTPNTAGNAEWQVVLPDTPTAQEVEAANQLVDKVNRATGVLLPIVAEATCADTRRIWIGKTQAGLAFANSAEINRTELGEDGFTIRESNGDLYFLAGPADGGPTEPLGVLYAVNHYLETQFGVRKWAPWALDIPRTTGFHPTPGLSITQIPPIWFRQVNYGPANDLEYRRWHKLDRVQEEVGRLWAPWWVHSAFRHLSPKDYFDKHPEYFALIGDTRTPSQLCMTHPDVLEIVGASIERTLAENPTARYISFSQEDNYDACGCADCAAIDEREGTQMGSLLTFVNALAERFPEHIISTLAYQYSRKPPRTLKPRSNVSIMLCTIEEDRARPITANPDSSFPAHMEGWSKIADDIFLWDYEVQFASPVAPFPNLRTLGPNVRWFADNGVRHVFLQGNGLRTEFAELRCYLLAKLAWDPNTDVDALIDEFLAGYYGPAAPHLRAYIDLLHDEVEASGEELVLYGNPALAKDSWLRQEVLAQAKKHFNAAEKVSNGSIYRIRVLAARLPLMYAELEIAKRLGAAPGGIWEVRNASAQAGSGNNKLTPRPQIRKLAHDFVKGCQLVDIYKLREYDLDLHEYMSQWETLLHPSLPNHLAYGAAIEAKPSPSSKYADGDVGRLVDGLPGGRPGSAPVTRAYGENWVGWMGTDAIITFTPETAEAARVISFHALQEPKSWIWLPRSIHVEGCTAEGVWINIATLTHDVDEHANLAHPFRVEIPANQTFKSFRLSVGATQTCPSWHLGAGQPSWFFLDELRVE